MNKYVKKVKYKIYFILLGIENIENIKSYSNIVDVN